MTIHEQYIGSFSSGAVKYDRETGEILIVFDDPGAIALSHAAAIRLIDLLERAIRGAMMLDPREILNSSTISSIISPCTDSHCWVVVGAVNNYHVCGYGFSLAHAIGDYYDHIAMITGLDLYAEVP